MAVTDDSLLTNLHDHHKDTFAMIRDREKQRDRLFIYVAALLGSIFLHRQYPEGVKQVLDALAGGNGSGLSKFPGDILENIGWVLLLFFSMRYFQASLIIDRQYDYIHCVERQLALIVDNESAFQREGTAYLKKYPAFSSWVWFIYQIAFPLLLITCSTILLVGDWPKRVEMGVLYWFESLIVCCIVITAFLRSWKNFVGIFNKQKTLP